MGPLVHEILVEGGRGIDASREDRVEICKPDSNRSILQTNRLIEAQSGYRPCFSNTSALNACPSGQIDWIPQPEKWVNDIK
jgi:hypothetical protein